MKTLLHNFWNSFELFETQSGFKSFFSTIGYIIVLNFTNHVNFNDVFLYNKGFADFLTNYPIDLEQYLHHKYYNNVKVHYKRLGSRGFHDLSNHYLCYFSKHNEYCKTEA